VIAFRVDKYGPHTLFVDPLPPAKSPALLKMEEEDIEEYNWREDFELKLNTNNSFFYRWIWYWLVKKNRQSKTSVEVPSPSGPTFEWKCETEQSKKAANRKAIKDKLWDLPFWL